MASVRLEAVPETLLWTLYHRATEARRRDGVLRDPKAVELVETIDFPFANRFGPARSGWAQWQALRALRFDREIESFLAEHPDGTVVALGEGLETQFWRVDNGRVQWLSVDLPETVELRRRLLPPPSRQRLLACPVGDERWLAEVDAGAGAIVTAQGLLMYLEPDEVHRVIDRCASGIAGGRLVFDAAPCWLSERSKRAQLVGAAGYRPPPWTWGIDAAEKRRIREHPGVGELVTLPLPRGRGIVFGTLLPLLGRVPGVREGMFSILRARLLGPDQPR
jgi:O-methyltransferase involved in polyketide biosynthesis